MILANTEELHDRIEGLLERIRTLEDALRTLQASVSTQPHPLLAETPTDKLPSTFPRQPTTTVIVTDSDPTEDTPPDSYGTDGIV